ncbi:xylulokinase [Fodinibius sediminis]|uniref:Xylulokinase n=1 Tax=Fodinibius sediminis TaxID=1214077 RepID=A0A521CRP5_9BACT|nr:FGGY family carbohydrate kinase [Fodinibius sediminis]SMO62078.1 xylulokinase [Fodinibius sediminis]
MQLLGYDVGSSSIKASLVNVESGKEIASATSPQDELSIEAPYKGWAEQDPETWWTHIGRVTASLLEAEEADPEAIQGIGIAYQMHGLVLVDKQQNVLRPAIIWCDGRAVEIGDKAFNDLGGSYCLEHYLNSPGNFTASKLRWVREHEPELYSDIHKAMLPGDYIAMKLTGKVRTSISGLSEAILWDYQSGDIATELLDYYDISPELLPDHDPNFAVSGELTPEAARQLGLRAGIPVGYRSGDQPNNALSLNVLNPGEAAATAGTSGVIYGVTDQPLYDELSRVNTFVHVNHDEKQARYGVLLCINGTGILNSWLKNELFHGEYSYDEMNERAATVDVGSEGVTVFPFGNGPERILQQQSVGAQLKNVDFNRHGPAHVIRASQEGIAFSMNYGLQLMRQMGMDIRRIRVSRGNMFLSPVFRQAFANSTDLSVELYESSGALGAAIGAGLGMGIYENRGEAFRGLQKTETLEPDPDLQPAYQDAYQRWAELLDKELKNKTSSTY